LDIKLLRIQYLFILQFLFLVPDSVNSQSWDIPVSFSRQAIPGKSLKGRYPQNVIYEMGMMDSVLVIRANQIRKFPGLLTGITLYSIPGNPDSGTRPHYKKIARINRRQIKSCLLNQVLQDAGDQASMDLKNRPGLDSTSQAKQYLSIYQDFIRGKLPDKNKLTHQWFTLAQIPVYNSEGPLYIAKIRNLFGKALFIYNDSLPARAHSFLPQADMAKCEPIDRVFAFKKLKGYGFQNIKPISYIPSWRRVFKKEFEIYFERNRSDVDQTQIQPIIDFLENNQYSVLNTAIEAYASVEGPAENNYQLQQKRAAQVIDILQKHNPDQISLDTVICNENWELFFKQIKKTSFEYLDSLAVDSIRVLLKDSSLLARLEPYLKYQRKGILKLTLANIFTQDQINSNLLEDIHQLGYALIMNRNDRVFQANRNKAAGILLTLESRVDKGLLSKDLAERTLREINNPVLWIMYFYNSVRKFEQNRKEPSLFDWNEILLHAQTGNLRLLQGTPIASQKELYIKQAVDIQYYFFSYILQGMVDWKIICNIDYPDDRLLYPLILNRLAFIYENAGTNLSLIPCNVDVKSDHTDRINLYDTIQYQVFRPIINIPEHLQSRYEGFDWKSKPQWNAGEKGPYYFFLKKVFISREESIKTWIIQPDNLYEFDLYHLLYRNVENWDPFRNYFYDEEVNFSEMSKLIEMLKMMDKRICPMQKNQLYLDFHLKSLYYFKLFGNPMNRDQVKTVGESVKFIGEYYRDRARILSSSLTLEIVKQLNLFTGLPGTEISTRWSYRILKAGLNKNYHSLEENRLYWLLASWYEPDFTGMFNNIELTGTDICILFAGRYSLKKWRKDLFDLYHHHCRVSQY
jgi:hypothetical protein